MTQAKTTLRRGADALPAVIPSIAFLPWLSREPAAAVFLPVDDGTSF
jgi:hypothetical protein